MSTGRTVDRDPVASRWAPRKATGPLLLLGVWVLVAGVLGFGDAALLEPFSVQLVELSVMLFAVGLILAAIAARPKTLRASLVQLELGPWIAVGFSIVFGISSLTWLKTPTDPTSLIVDTSFLVPAGILALLGLIVLLVSYRLCPRGLTRAYGRVDAAIRGDAPVQVSLGSIITLWALWILATAVEIFTGNYGYLSDVSQVTTGSAAELLALISHLGLLATLLAGWRYAQSRTAASRLVLAVVLVSQLALGLFSANKEPFVVQLLAAFVGYSLNRRIRVLPIAAAVAVFIFFVSPFVTSYRTDVNTGSGRLSPGQALSSVSLGSLTSSAAGSSRTSAFDYFVNRLSRVGDLAVILQKTPSVVPYISPAELVEAPVLGIVPRSIWKNKPVLDASTQMSQIYYEIPASVHTSSAMTPYGDLWRRGGLGVVAVGMLVLGLFLRMVDARPGDCRRDPRLLFLPMLLFVTIFKQETDYESLLASLVSIIVVAGLAARLVTILSPRSTREPGQADDVQPTISSI